MNLKPIAYMKPSILETLQPHDCFIAFVDKDKHATVPIFTWEQVKEMLHESNESRFDAEDYVNYAEEYWI